MPKTKNVTPIYTSPSGRYIRWDMVLRDAKRQPREWIPVFWNEPATRADAIRQRRGHDLRSITGGHLEADARNRHRTEDGAERCDLFVRWLPWVPSEDDGNMGSTEGATGSANGSAR